MSFSDINEFTFYLAPNSFIVLHIHLWFLPLASAYQEEEEQTHFVKRNDGLRCVTRQTELEQPFNKLQRADPDDTHSHRINDDADDDNDYDIAMMGITSKIDFGYEFL